MTPRTYTTLLEIDGKEYNVPTAYICPISLDIMTHPLVTRSGHRFERAAIQAWLTEDGSNPLTREAMGPRDLIPDYRLQDEIRFWKEKHGMIEMSYIHFDERDRNEFDGLLFASVNGKLLSPANLNRRSNTTVRQGRETILQRSFIRRWRR